MTSTRPHPEWTHTPCYFLLLALFCLSGTACSTTAQDKNALLEDPRGSVSLQAIPDPSIQASHPINLDQGLIARVLNGLKVQERQRTLQEILAGSSPADPVFSDEQVQFLAPRIAKALTTATAGETVSFLVRSPRPNSGRLENALTETTAGSLYAYGLSLYVTLSQYRYAPGQPNADSTSQKRLLDSSGLSNRTLHFTPSAAQRSDTFQRPTGGATTDRMIVVDYQLLQHAVVSGPTVTPPLPAERAAAPALVPPPDTKISEAAPQSTGALSEREAELHALKDLVIKKDLELESLRKELQSVRKQLDSQNTKQDTKRKPSSPSKLQQTAP